MNEDTRCQGAPASAEAPDYLWNRSGPPDPEIQELETKLAAFRFKGGELPEANAPSRSWSLLSSRRGLLAAAVVAIAGVGLWYVIGRGTATWRVEPLGGGQFLVGEQSYSSARDLNAGEWVETQGPSRARIRVPRLGRVDVEGGSRVQLVSSGRDGSPDHRLELSRGVIDVSVHAPPRVFFVDTPSATAVDYGCEYQLETDEYGHGTLRVTKGLVKLVRRQANGGSFESSVYAGMHCRMIPGMGPGTPYQADSSQAFFAGLANLDDGLAYGRATPEEVDATLARVLSEASRSDSVTLWHLLPRLDGDRRERVYTRLAQLVPPPKGVTKEKVRSLDADAMERWWKKIY